MKTDTPEDFKNAKGIWYTNKEKVIQLNNIESRDEGDGTANYATITYMENGKTVTEEVPLTDLTITGYGD